MHCTIRVTAEDIRQGTLSRQKNQGLDVLTTCPVGRACTRIFGDAKVGATRVWMNSHTTIPLPFRAQIEIHNFDMGHDIQPFEFEIVTEK